MKFGVVIFPGSNCDHDMLYALEHILGQPTEALWHKDKGLKGCDFIVLPGGFSYGDYLRSGAIARFSPVMDSVVEHARSGGYVLGVCNGFQILCESGLLPGALLRNENRKFICKNVFIKAGTDNALITSGIQRAEALSIPIAHAEGRYYADEGTLDALEKNGQVIFRYCGPEGQVDDAGNPNGSARNIAGICNEGRNVFGMMPHPERAVDETLRNTDGRKIFQGIVSPVTA